MDASVPRLLVHLRFEDRLPGLWVSGRLSRKDPVQSCCDAGLQKIHIQCCFSAFATRQQAKRCFGQGNSGHSGNHLQRIATGAFNNMLRKPRQHQWRCCRCGVRLLSSSIGSPLNCNYVLLLTSWVFDTNKLNPAWVWL